MELWAGDIGGSQAILDAETLATALARTADVTAALHAMVFREEDDMSPGERFCVVHRADNLVSLYDFASAQLTVDDSAREAVSLVHLSTSGNATSCHGQLVCP